MNTSRVELKNDALLVKAIIEKLLLGGMFHCYFLGLHILSLGNHFLKIPCLKRLDN